MTSQVSILPCVQAELRENYFDINSGYFCTQINGNFNLILFLPCLVFVICSCKGTNVNFINMKNIHARNVRKKIVNYYLNASIFKSFNVESEM